jgi:hypothetical protein
MSLSLHADVVFNTFVPAGPFCVYPAAVCFDNTSGFGAVYPSQFAYSFTVTGGNFRLDRIQLEVALDITVFSSPVPSVDIWLMSDDANSPEAVIESYRLAS